MVSRNGFYPERKIAGGAIAHHDLPLKAVNNHVKKILFIAGTRPEAIKLAPVYLEMRRRGAFNPVICATGQHEELADHGFAPFEIYPDITLNTMEAGQSLHRLTGRLFMEVGNVIRKQQPDVVIVQGDTVSAFAGGWCAFFEKRPVVHVEAGLRTGDLEHPFPEEAMRAALTIISTTHMAPTAAARDNLLREGIAPERVVVTGNTSIDALYLMVAKHEQKDSQGAPEKRQILVTGHRRENFGQGLENLCHALLELAAKFPDVEITYAVHPNPAVAEPVRRRLGSAQNIQLLPPLDYEEFTQRMLQSYFIISDSGGVQEEAPALGKPVLITRQVTERPEAVDGGANRIVGTDAVKIVRAATELLTRPEVYDKMSTAGCPYGDGKAAGRICDYVEGLAQRGCASG